MAYTVEFKTAAARDLSALPKNIQERIAVKINVLASDPRPYGVKKLEGEEGLFRIRVGNYRIIYAVNDEARAVLVVRIRHRHGVYRRL